MGEWRRYFFHRKESVRTTSKLRVGTLVVVILIASVTRGFWVSRLAGSLVCTQELAPSDIILVENFDPNYLVFKRAAELQKAGFAPRALVPVAAPRHAAIADPVSQGIADVMARQARLGVWEIIPILETEPITLNAGRQIRDRLATEQVRSLIVVTSGFRSRRTSLVYHTLLADAGTQVYCAPVFDRRTPERWTETWHGIQEVTEEFLKLQYYRLYVIPFLARRAS